MKSRFTFWCAVMLTSLSGMLWDNAQAQTFSSSTPEMCTNDPDFYLEVDAGDGGFIRNVTWEVVSANTTISSTPSDASLGVYWARISVSQTSPPNILKVRVNYQQKVNASAWSDRYHDYNISIAKLPSVNISSSISGPSNVGTGVATVYTANISQPVNVVSYQWLVDGLLATTTTSTSATITFATPGSHTLVCAPVNRCGQSTRTISRVVDVCLPVEIDGPAYICPGKSITLTAESDATAPSYNWTKDGSPIGSGTGELSVSQAGTYSVTAAFGEACIVTASKVITESAPPTSPITAIKGLNVILDGEITPLEVLGAEDATEFEWNVLEAPQGLFDDAQGNVWKRKVLFTPAFEGDFRVAVTPIKNTCRGIPFDRPFEAISESRQYQDSVKMFHSDLNAPYGTVAFLSLPTHRPNFSGCYNELGPVTLNISFDLGKYYNLGKHVFNSNVNMTVTAYYDVTGAIETWTFPLHLDQNAPEQLFSRRITVNPELIRFFRISATGYTNSSAAAANSIRLKASYSEENIVDVSTVELTPVNPEQNPANKRWEQTFTWGTSCADVPNYVFQILKQYGQNPPETGSPNNWTEATWKNALLIETESSAPSITLSMGEGTGLYYWRVFPVGNRPGGITNQANWGTAYYPPSPLDYHHPEADKNWIYSRTFTEGNKVTEGVTYATGLLTPVQQVTRRQDENKIIAAQTILDYTGRSAINTLPIPVADVTSLQYVNSLLTIPSSDPTQAPRLYGAADFDGVLSPPKAKERGGYYSGSNVAGIDNRRVASAEGYPFSQTIFATDGTGQVKEQASAGSAHSKAGGRTTRRFYDAASEGELVSLFGSEAPDYSSVQKIIEYDANNVASVAFQTKDGKLIATALTLTGDNSIPLKPLPTATPTKFFENVKNNQRVNNSTVVSRKPLFLSKTGVVAVSYEITPSQLNELCAASSCTTCDYTVSFRFLREGVPVEGVTLPSKVIRANACNGTGDRTHTIASFNLSLDGGVNYTLEKYLTLNVKTFSQPTKTYLDSAKYVLESDYRYQADMTLWEINGYITRGEFAELNAHLAQVGTYNQDNNQYKVPLFPAGSNECQQFIYIPKAVICPPDDVVDEATYTMNGLSFEAYFEKYYLGRESITIPGNSVLEYLYFTNQFRKEDQYFPALKFNAMVADLINRNGQLAKGEETAAERVWRVWKNEVIAYEENVKYTRPVDQDLADLGTAVPAKFSLLTSFLSALDAELQSTLTQTDQDVCAMGTNRPPFIVRDILYGRLTATTETSNNITDFQASAQQPDLAYAHRLVYYDVTVESMKRALQFYANIAEPTPQNPRDPVISDFKGMLPCDKYKFSQSTNFGDPGIAQGTEEQALELEKDNLQKLRNNCGTACDSRAEEFRQASINALLKAFPAAVIQHYNVYSDATYRKDAVWVGVLDSTRNKTQYSFSQCELEAMVDALVKNCKDNYCNTTLTVSDMIVPGRAHKVRVYGTADERKKIEKAVGYNFDVKIGTAGQTCDVGWDAIESKTTTLSLFKKSLVEGGSRPIFQVDKAGNHYVLADVRDSDPIALKESNGNIVYLSNNDGTSDGVVAKYDPRGNLLWWRLWEGRPRQQLQARSSAANSVAGTASPASSLSISATGNVLFCMGIDAASDYYYQGTLVHSGQPGWETLSCKLDSNGNLVWSHLENIYWSDKQFLQEDSQGNSYMMNVEARVVKRNSAGEFVWRSDNVMLSPNMSGTFPSFKVDATGNVYVFHDRSSASSTNLKVIVNGAVIETLNSPTALMIFKLGTDGHYVWHHAYELNVGFPPVDCALSLSANSIFLSYSKSLLDRLTNQNEFGINYTLASTPSRVVYAEISPAKALLSYSYFDNTRPTVAGVLPTFNVDNNVKDYWSFWTTPTGYSFMEFNKNTKTFTDLGVKAQGFNINSFLVTESGKFEYFLESSSPFRHNGPALYAFSTLSSMQILFKDSLVQSCGHPAICFTFTTSRLDSVKVIPGMKEHVYNPKVISCSESTTKELRDAIDLQVQQMITARVKSYSDRYYSTCSDPSKIKDRLTIEKTDGLHHFTLYYYDRAGNLVRTVPPEGVIRRDVSTDALLEDAKKTPIQHALITEYQYNSLGNLIRQHSPDGNYLHLYSTDGQTANPAPGFEKPVATDHAALNASKYYNTVIYNDKGMTRFSRNAQQKIDGTYSYTKYDELGRVIEVGEGKSFNEAAIMARRNDIGVGSYPTEQVEFVTRTVYSKPFETTSVDQWPSIYHQDENNLLNRVSYTFVDKDGNDRTLDDRTYTVYDYDAHGNVRWLVQKIPGLAPVGVRYEYDLLTGSVKDVAFSAENSNTSFYHRYEYDADKRLKKAQTSRDRLLWETEAMYNYYVHGPLKRMALGEDLVQGIDYTYTIQGWLKGINHGMLDPTIDPGEDATGTSKVARDAFGMALGYYAGDYVNDSEARFADGQPGNFSLEAGAGLYNGNIATWTSNMLYPSGSGLTDPQLTANKYTYDVLNRLLTSRFHTYAAQAPTIKFPAADRFKSKYTYDANGNITKAVTGSNTTTDLDRITYKYELLNNYKVNNRLNSASDSTGLVNGYLEDIEPGQVAYNYQYDAIGNLTHDLQQQVKVTWNPYGKVENVIRTQAGKDYITYFMYDATGNRVAKKRTNPVGLNVTDYYVRDATGNIMAIYQKTEQDGQQPKTLITELPIYGSNRLGTYSRPLASHLGGGLTETEEGELRISGDDIKSRYEERSYLLNADVELTIASGFEYQASVESAFRIRAGVGPYEQNPDPLGGVSSRLLNSRRYQLSDHLGNVRAITTDIKLSTISGSTPTDFRPDVVSISNYYPFGMEMPGRAWASGEKYRYGFNGKEKDSNGEWGLTHYDYGFRIYNPGLGKFLSVDPLTAGYPSWSPYPFAMNSPIIGVDLDGRELDLYLDAARDFTFGFKRQVANNYQIAERIILHPIETTKSIVSFSYDKTKTYVTNNSVGQILQDYGEKIVTSPLEYSGPAIVYHQFKDGPVTSFLQGDFKKSGAGYANHLTSAVPELIGLRGKAPAKVVGVIAKYKPCGCFTADTEILMADGQYKSIDKIEVGDKVLAYSDSVGYFESKVVISIFSLNFDEILKIYADDQVIEVTNEHPFLVGSEWIKAGELMSGDRMTLYPKGQLKIDSIVHVAGNFKVYNFTVADYHTYYVSTKNILVHNGNPCKFAKLLDFVSTEAGAQVDTKVADNVKMIEWIREKNGGVDRDWPFAPLRAVEVDGKKVLLDGHHRYEAAQKAGYTGNIPYETVPVEESGYTLEKLRTFLPKEN
jgi:RHS repeat-associated protein